LDIKQAKVQRAAEPLGSLDALVLEVASQPSVERINLRWRQANLPGFHRQESDLVCGSNQGSQKVWSSPPEGIPVPKKATVVFDLVYYVGGRKFTDDNQGRWYIAD
jgi:hypothetical protein